MESITFAVNNSVLFDHSFRPRSLLLSNLKLRSRSLSAMMDLMRNRANFALLDSVYKSRSIAWGARFRAKILQLPVGRPYIHSQCAVGMPCERSKGRSLRYRFSSWSGQGKGDESITQWLFCDLGMATGGDYYVLFSVRAEAIGHGSSVSAIWKLSLP
jgi:hypothetical protein